MAVFAFLNDDRHSKTADVHRDSHGLTPSRKCGQPPAVVVQRLAADGGVISIASFDTLRKVVVALRGAFL